MGKVMGGGKGPREERTRYKPGKGAQHAGGAFRGVGGARGGFGRGGPGGPAGPIRKERSQRFGKLVSESDTVKDGKYMPWAAAQAPGSVREVTFNAESRASYLTGFRKRKTERQTFAKKSLSEKEKNELKKGRRERKTELMEKYNARMAEMQKIADEAARLERLKESGQLLRDVDADDSDDSDDSHEESEEEQLSIGPPKKQVIAFGDARAGTATRVEVQEMDLAELQESAVGSHPDLLWRAHLLSRSSLFADTCKRPSHRWLSFRISMCERVVASLCVCVWEGGEVGCARLPVSEAFPSAPFAPGRTRFRACLLCPRSTTRKYPRNSEIPVAVSERERETWGEPAQPRSLCVFFLVVRHTCTTARGNPTLGLLVELLVEW
jgi:hypothetical protein